MNQQNRTSYLVQLSLLAAVEIVLAFTPLGFIPLGATNATTIHIPVILGGILLGPAAGAILGGVFGLASIITNTVRPGLTSFVFSPFYTAGGVSGGLRSLVVALVPRILVGVVAALIYRLVMMLSKEKSMVSGVIAGVVGSLTNTALVLTGIFYLFGQDYAAIKGFPVSELFPFLMGIVTINGLPEAAVAGVLCGAILQPLLRLRNKKTV